MDAKEFSKLIHLVSNARETAEALRDEMKILNRHECACADAQIVLHASSEIEKGLYSALETLKKLGAEKITKVAGD